jgi:hypothetical protein
MMSPALNPARAAGPPGATSVIKAALTPRYFVETPIQPGWLAVVGTSADAGTLVTMPVLQDSLASLSPRFLSQSLVEYQAEKTDRGLPIEVQLHKE